MHTKLIQLPGIAHVSRVVFGVTVCVFIFLGVRAHGYDASQASVSCLNGIENLDIKQARAVDVLLEKLDMLVDMNRISVSRLVAIMSELKDESSLSLKKRQVLEILYDYYSMVQRGEACDTDGTIIDDIIGELGGLDDENAPSDNDVDDDFVVCPGYPHPWAVDPAPGCRIEIVEDTRKNCKYGKIICEEKPVECAKPPLPHDNCRYRAVAVGSAIGACPLYEVICGEKEEKPADPQCLTITKPPLEDGCRYGPLTKDQAGCPAYSVICDEDVGIIGPSPSECPVYKLPAPPTGCEYVWYKNTQGCELPRLKCSALGDKTYPGDSDAGLVRR